MPRNFVFGIRGCDRVERPEREQHAVRDDEPVPGLRRRLQVRRAVGSRVGRIDASIDTEVLLGLVETQQPQGC